MAAPRAAQHRRRKFPAHGDDIEPITEHLLNDTSEGLIKGWLESVPVNIQVIVEEEQTDRLRKLSSSGSVNLEGT
jgi:predicted oxidoreductase